MDYLGINREFWDNCVDVHLASAFYRVDDFINGKSSLTPIESVLLGDLTGKSLLHFQCHFGQDTLSLARLGARCTGVDFSPKAIEAARSLAGRVGVAAGFICSDIYSLPDSLD